MVGPPKNLSDLRRVEADVKVTCRRCGHSKLLDRERLIGELLRRQRNLTWSELPHQMVCSKLGCGSKDVAVLAIPFSSEPERPPPPEFDLFVQRANEMLVALRNIGDGVPGLERAATARSAFEDARRKLAAWCAHRNV